jgi:hypothetical protein
VVPVIMPACQHFDVVAGRPLIIEEKWALMGFPTNILDFGANSEQELNHMAGNAMHVRSVFLALLVALTVVDFNKFARLSQVLPTQHHYLLHA